MCHLSMPVSMSSRLAAMTSFQNFPFQTQLLLQGINSLGSLSLSQVLIVCIRVTSFFAECFEIRSLGTSHGIITTHPFVRFLLIGCVRVKLRVFRRSASLLLIVSRHF